MHDTCNMAVASPSTVSQHRLLLIAEVFCCSAHITVGLKEDTRCIANLDAAYLYKSVQMHHMHHAPARCDSMISRCDSMEYMHNACSVCTSKDLNMPLLTWSACCCPIT